ncbi:MAG: flagellar brake protein [Methylobacter sp.]|nr:flagellar brake protein [Methylobacter sp.]MDP2099429.1 flagellar brake protein [Methylobacter sp.]MDP2430101.1 flagellar brake protein [Methylobacter sp.]MDP3056056.1 flagellar brake protein [Methylobacter sp.]MDP3362196.1 flagellar brake protein [Methylobacter sp.]
MSDISSSFLIQNPKQIVNHLSLLVKSKCLLGACFGAANESYITTLLGVDEKNNAVILDYATKEYLNQHIMRAGKVTFDGEYEGVKVSFSGSEIKKITHKGEDALIMPLPKTLYWMQRREYYRVKSPLSNPSYCQLTLGARDPVNLPLYDISLTGFSMLNQSKEISDLLAPGNLLSGCKLILSEVETGFISFEICAKYIINPDKAQKIQKIGCKFVDLSLHVEEAIQRNMQQIQRNSLQK